MPEFVGLIELDIPRSHSNEFNELRFWLRRLKAENPELNLLGSDGREVGVGIEWWTREEPRTNRVSTVLRGLIRHLKSAAMISVGCEPVILESRFRPLGNETPHLHLTIRY